MGSFSIWHWIIVLVIVLLLFGRGKIPSLMGDVAAGIKSFRKGMKEEPGAETKPEPPVINQQGQPTGGSANAGTPADKSAHN
ncbi:twin-arginine translocase TatA/TatE family subunit [Ferrovibrio xuzhouensis]|uniref:Sec-independent protein translocase protein TatA n=1 Tax=Ferrovibrio xuzhouensis TaxID=1576914 RepID=A0ABV7VLN0_9PROT